MSAINHINQLIIQVVSGNTTPELENIKNQSHPKTRKSNEQAHREQIIQLIDKIKISDRNKTYVLTRLSYLHPNIVDIDLCVTKSSSGKINFYFVGRDLAFCYKSLPSYTVNLPNNRKINIYPRTGTSHSKFYPDLVEKPLIEIAINFRMLELYGRNQKMTTGALMKSNRLLGSDIPFDIPQLFGIWEELVSSQEINSGENPIKIKDGQFFYGKNGVGGGRTGWMLTKLFENIPHFAQLCCPRVISSYDLTRFIMSDFVFAMTSWNRHSRLIIKLNKSDEEFETAGPLEDNETEESDNSNQVGNNNEETENAIGDEVELESEHDEQEPNHDLDMDLVKDKFSSVKILIIDPWMKRLPEKVFTKLNEKNNLLDFKLYNRLIRDQNKEGSCVLCTLSRLIYLMSSVSIDSDLNKEIELQLNKPIPDFYAYLSKFLFRKTAN